MNIQANKKKYSKEGQKYQVIFALNINPSNKKNY
jgi:hypothetical protein